MDTEEQERGIAGHLETTSAPDEEHRPDVFPVGEHQLERRRRASGQMPGLATGDGAASREVMLVSGDGSAGREVPPVSVFDGALTTGPLAATITFTNVDDAPVITANSLTISEGQTVVLGATDLAATDAETLDSTLQFTVSSVTGGQFELVASPGVAITTFTQAQVTSGSVHFVHDGGEAAPSFDVSVFDGALTTGPQATAITFTNVNDAPVIGNNSLTLSEGQTVVLGAGDLSATDVDNLDSSLQFTVSA